MDSQQEKPKRWKRFIKETGRVMRITKKPGREEFMSLVKVTALGGTIIGLIGFVIFLVKQFIL